MSRSGVVKHEGDVEQIEVAAGTATVRRVLIGPDDEAHNFFLRRFTMGEGGAMPLHTNRVEHEQYVLSGAARVRIGEKVHEVRAGDALFIPAGVPHSYQVTEPPFDFLCIVPAQPDAVALIEPT
jgi:quercetin dioxygenase-like cupin family protein